MPHQAAATCSLLLMSITLALCLIQLCCSKRVTQLVGRCYGWLRRIRSCRRALTQSAAKTLVNSFIVARIDYCNSLLAGYGQQQIDKLSYSKSEERQYKVSEVNVCYLWWPRFSCHISQPAVDCLQITVQFSYRIYASRSLIITRKLSYRKDDRATCPIYESPENFRESLTADGYFSRNF